MNIHNKYFGKIFSAQCVDVFPELFQIFLNFDISWYMTKYSEVHLKNCLLIHYCSISKILYNLVGLVDTSEYSKIYREQLTSEHFLPYNYRSSTLPRISRNIGRLLRQCGEEGSCPGLGSKEGRYPIRISLCPELWGNESQSGTGDTVCNVS